MGLSWVSLGIRLAERYRVKSRQRIEDTGSAACIAATTSAPAEIDPGSGARLLQPSSRMLRENEEMDRVWTKVRWAAVCRDDLLQPALWVPWSDTMKTGLECSSLSANVFLFLIP